MNIYMVDDSQNVPEQKPSFLDEVKAEREALEKALHKLKISEAYQKIIKLDDWNTHFQTSKQRLDSILDDLKIKYEKSSYGK